MKEELRSSEGMDIRTTFVPDVDADDAKASGMLGMIGRVEAEESGADEKPQPVMRTSQGASPFLLESLYFRSFGERGLLTREEEITIAKRVDQGTRRIRTSSASSSKGAAQVQAYIRPYRHRESTSTGQTIERVFSHRIGQCGEGFTRRPESVGPRSTDLPQPRQSN